MNFEKFLGNTSFEEHLLTTVSVSLPFRFWAELISLIECELSAPSLVRFKSSRLAVFSLELNALQPGIAYLYPLRTSKGFLMFSVGLF